MTTNDRSRQQSGEGFQAGAQQGGWQPAQDRASQAQGGQQSTTARGAQGDWQPGARSLPAQRGGYDPALYGAFGGGPFALMRRISEEMDRMFESFGMGGPLAGGWPTGMEGTGRAAGALWSPRLEVFERDGRLVIQVDLPGVRKEDVNVRIEDDRVVIQGERHQEARVEDPGYFHTERSYGSFHRVIPLAEGVDADQAKATFRDGVLEIELPAPQPRQRGRALTIEDRSAGAATEGSAGGGSGSAAD